MNVQKENVDSERGEIGESKRISQYEEWRKKKL